MSKVKSLPKRSQTQTKDRWDLSSLFASDKEWEKAFQRWEKRAKGYDRYRDKLAESASTLARCFRFDSQLDREGERLGTFAFLKSAEDTADGRFQRMLGRYRNAASEAAQAASFIRPEIMAIPGRKMSTFLKAKVLERFRLQLQRMLRYKDHTLGPKEERLLAMAGEMAQSAKQVFGQLHDADMKYGFVRNEKGENVELGNASFSVLLHSSKRQVRKAAFHQYYAQFEAHQNTLASTLAGSIQGDVFYAKARGYSSALDAALFADKVPPSVYENLIASVHHHLPTLHRYYDLRRRKMRLRDIHHYDTYVPILSGMQSRYSWSDAVKTVLSSLQPLGSDYCGALEKGLRGRWCDRYPNQGKQSGAFSCGSYDGDPYILMNYEPDLLDHVFTLAHEAGHSMHSYYSAKSQPFEYYDYTIFVAEVASTLNEQLLSAHLLGKAKTKQERAYLINREIDAIRGTIFRQTMFAEFEKITHELAEQGEPLTVDRFRQVYGELLRPYFGPKFSIDDVLHLECFRIPHFYRAFYVYKYATGMSAAIALAHRIAGGGRKELTDYLNFLNGGCAKYPLDLLRDAGVDMEKREPVDTALSHFARLVDELDELI